MKQFVHSVIGAALVCAALAWAPPARAERAVVELYTSQGCNSCPPADALLSELAKQPGILALSFHVTYWDYLGWRDTFGNPANTKRQRWYKKVLGAQVYTPQAVVNGTKQAVGNQRGAVEMAMEDAPPLTVPVSLVADGKGGLTAKLAGTGQPVSADVFVVRFDSTGTVAIERGENRGRTMSYSNVVRDMKPLGRYSGEAVQFDLPQIAMWAQGSDRCAILVQDMKSGRILGAASTTLR